MSVDDTKNDGWISLNGCNACINSDVCDGLGNCVLLTVNQHVPENNKRKRKLIGRIRTYGSGSLDQLKKQIHDAKVREQATVVKIDEPFEALESSPRLTIVERMFIESLNKPRP